MHQMRRITFAALVLELRRRAGADALHPARIPEVITELGKLAVRSDSAESALLREILGAALVVHSELELEGRALDALTPETVLRLDAVLAALIDGTVQREELRTELRRALMRPVS
jgi:hypothetical protein